MAEAKSNSFDAYKAWPESLRDSVDQLGGNPFSLLVMATMYAHQDESLTATGLKKLFIEKAGTEEGVPRDSSFLHVMKKLASGPNPLLSTIPQRRMRTQISRRGQEHGAAYAGPILQFCLENTRIYPQDLLGWYDRRNPVLSDPAHGGHGSLRVGLYTLLGETDKPLTTSSISRALGIGQGYGNQLINPLGKLGVLDIQTEVNHIHEPFSVAFTDTYRQPLSTLASNVNALAIPGGGIVDGLDMAEAVLKDPTDFAYLLSLRTSQVIEQRKQS